MSRDWSTKAEQFLDIQIIKSIYITSSKPPTTYEILESIY